MSVIYRYIINPIIIILFNLLAIFKQDVKMGLKQRRLVIRKLENWLKENKNDKKRVIFHTASLGEFEHIKPLLVEIKNKYKTQNIVTFFSASGYDNAKLTRGMDYKSYVPMESIPSWTKFYRNLSPALIAIAKHDIWPAQIWAADRLNIPVYLINASLSEASSRTNGLVKKFLGLVYKLIEKIYAISEEDAERFRSVYNLDNVEFLGDTKYDQVVFRKKSAEKQKLLPGNWIINKKVVVCGSIWPEDAKHLFPGLEKLLSDYADWKVIIVPHEPSEENIFEMEHRFRKWGTAKFSKSENLQDERVLLVDIIGYLAGLYYYADIAYVGGSFKQGIHNVMEPAIFGIPVMFGPMHKNSFEAVQLSKNNGGIVIKNKEDIIKWLAVLVKNREKREFMGEKALLFANANTGATEKLFIKWQDILSEK